MADLRRLRLDEYGLLTQDGKGVIRRVRLDQGLIERLKANQPDAKFQLRTAFPELAAIFAPDGSLNVRFDSAVEPTPCLSRPLRIYYSIEPRCNLLCSFCGPRDLRGATRMSPPETERFLLEQIARSGAFQVQLTGGEVFLRGWELLSTLKLTSDLGLATLLATNGVWTQIKDREAFLKELAKHKHVVEVKVSIDGDEQFHDSVRGPGAYRQAVATVFDLSRHGIPVRINTTVFKASCTADQIEHLARLACQAGATLQAIPERSCGRAGGKTAYELPAKEALRAYTLRATELREELRIPISFNFDIFQCGRLLPHYDPGRPFSCGAGLWGFALTHLGEVYPCGFTMDIRAPRSFLAGVVSEEHSLLDIWLSSPVLYEWRHAGKAPACHACAHYSQTCWGGCMVQAFVGSGQLDAMDPYCPKTNEMLCRGVTPVLAHERNREANNELHARVRASEV